MARCYPWRDVIHGEMLSMTRCYYRYPWHDVIITIHGEMLLSLSMAKCYPWRDVIITHGRLAQTWGGKGYRVFKHKV